MNKTELIAYVARKASLSSRAAREVVESIFSPGKEGLIASALMSGKKVQITGFGTFVIRQKRERRGLNPQTGEEMLIKPRRSVVFRPSKLFGPARSE